MLSDCPKCWETPCVCGYEYMDWSDARLAAQIKMLTNVLHNRKRKTVLISTEDQLIEHFGKERSVSQMSRVKDNIILPRRVKD